MKAKDKTKEQYINELMALRRGITGLKTPASGSELTEQTIKHTLDFVITVSNISSRFVGVADIDYAINTSLGEMGKFAEASRAYLFLFRENGTIVDNTHEWCDEGVSPQINNLQNLPTDMVPWWMEKLHQGEIIHIKDVAKMPVEAKAEKEILEKQDIKSLLVFPLNIEEKLIGFIGFDNVREPGEWNNDGLILLRISSEIIESALKRRWDEIALRESERRYRLIADNVTDVIWTMDMNLRYTYVSPSITRLRGYSVEEVMAQTLEEILSPASREIAKKVCAEELAIEKTGRKDLSRSRILELELICKDGSTIWAEVKMAFLRNSNGFPIGVLGITRDITERKQAEKLLRIKDSAIASSCNGIGIADLEGNVTYVNNSFLKMWGYNDDREVIGKPALKFWGAEEKTSAAIESLCEKGSWIGEIVAIRKDSSKFDVQLSATIVKDAADRPICMMGCFVDITDRKISEKELKLLATTDALTEVLNRRSGLLLFKQQIQMSKRNNSKLSICYVDVDDLKKINDTYGHQEGDEVLKIASRFIKAALREVDIICRLGGDEFLLILSQCQIEQAISIWQRVAKNIANFNNRKIKPYLISLSRGFAEYNPADEKTVEQLIAIADKEMYQDKRSKDTNRANAR